MASNKKVTCPICKERLISLEGLYDHLLEDHENEIPEDYSAARYYYLLRTGKEHGSCIVCKNDTEWNDATNKYKRFCNNPKCKERYREMFKSRMVNKYGKTTLLDDPDQQRKMLANRKISGVYKWSDGKSEKTYTGSYELDFLTMLDKFMGFDADDIMSPSPHTYNYKFEGENKFYIPDFYIPSLNLEIEVKDGGDNPNTHNHMERDRKKERLKDDVMSRQRNIDYIKIVDKNYDNFFNYLLGKKEEVITESYLSTIIETNDISKEYYQPLIDFLNENYIEPEEIMTEGNALYDRSHKFPIFIVLMHSGTLLANAVKKVTGDEFSHACISFNTKLTPLYSFGIKDLDMKQTGFVANSPKSSFFTKFKAKYAVYVMFVDRISLKKMQDRLKFFIQHDDELKYDIVALIRNFFGLQSENERKYFCSRFVADIINAGKQLERLPSMYRPQDFNNFEDIEKVDEGEDFYQYDYKKVERNISVIKKRDE